VVVAALIGGSLVYVFDAGMKAGSSHPTETVNLINTASQTLGAGVTNAVVADFTPPSGSTNIYLDGWVNVTTCSTGGNCLALVEVMTPTAWSNLQGGSTVTVVWCYSVSSTCTGLQYNDVTTGSDLTGYAGTALVLVVFNSDTVFSQTIQADVNLVYNS
jgi:hypothetical protein